MTEIQTYKELLHDSIVSKINEVVYDLKEKIKQYNDNITALEQELESDKNTYEELLNTKISEKKYNDLSKSYYKLKKLYKSKIGTPDTKPKTSEPISKITKTNPFIDKISVDDVKKLLLLWFTDKGKLNKGGLVKIKLKFKDAYTKEHTDNLFKSVEGDFKKETGNAQIAQFGDEYLAKWLDILKEYIYAFQLNKKEGDTSTLYELVKDINGLFNNACSLSTDALEGYQTDYEGLYEFGTKTPEEKTDESDYNEVKGLYETVANDIELIKEAYTKIKK